MLVLAAADPNWFYSTLAQATAALVGLAGAFLVQRLLIQRSDIGPQRQALRERCLGLQRRMSDQRAYVEGSLEAIEEALEELEEGGPVRRSMNPLSADSTDTSGEVGLQQIDQDQGLAILRDAAHRVRTLRDESASLTWEDLVEGIRLNDRLPRASAAWLEEPRQIPEPPWTSVQPGLGMWPRLEMQGVNAAAWWRVYRQDSEAIGTQLEAMRSKLAPRSLYVLFGILGALLLVGVVAPLFFLSAEGGPSKWLLLVGFIPLALAFVLFYGYELRRLRRADRLLKEDW